MQQQQQEPQQEPEFRAPRGHGGEPAEKAHRPAGRLGCVPGFQLRRGTVGRGTGAAQRPAARRCRARAPPRKKGVARGY